MDIEKMNHAVTRAMVVTVVGPVIAIIAFAAILYVWYDTHKTLIRLVESKPIYVVPGALGGQYTTGIGDQDLIDTARYWTGLIANFNRRSAKDRLSELEGYADNGFLVGYQKLKDQTLAEVEQQSQGRSFAEMKDTASLERAKDGSFIVRVRGDRTFFSAGIVLYEDQADVEWRFKFGPRSEKNRHGLIFTGVNVKEVPGTKRTN